MTAEFALALPLLVVAGLLLNSFVRLGSIPAIPGIVAVEVSLPTVRYPDSLALRGFWQRAEDLAAGLPGVAAAGLASDLPRTARAPTTSIWWTTPSPTAPRSRSRPGTAYLPDISRRWGYRCWTDGCSPPTIPAGGHREPGLGRKYFPNERPSAGS